MKKTFCLILALVLVLAAVPCAAEAQGDPSFLIGDWSTSDGVELSFYDDGTFELAWSFLPTEEGQWAAEAVSDDTFRIEMDGSSILYLMSLIYGAADSDYHFEALKCNRDNFYLVQVYGDYTAKSSPCKLGFTRDGCARDFSYREDAADTAPEEELYGNVTVDWHGRDFSLDLYWDWDLFDQPASSYDHDLAIAGLTLSKLIHDKDTFRGELEGIFGFGDVDYRDWSTPDTPAYALAHRRVTLSGGDREIVLLVLRGTNMDLDGPNDLIDDVKSQVDGFRPATRNINNILEKYVKDHGFGKEEMVLFITGHSLGGAVAQSLAPFAENYVTSDENCFIYTYAAPNCFIDLFKNREFRNVHNIINVNDAVPYVPVMFGKYGRELYYNSSDPKYFDTYAEAYGEEGWFPLGLLEKHDVTTYLSMMLTALPSGAGSGAVNHYSVTSIHCPVDIEVYDADGNRMGWTSGDEVTLEETSQVLILAHDGEKEIAAPPGVEYSVRITGTGDGTMTVVHRTLDAETHEVLTEREYGDVPVTGGETFELAAKGGDMAQAELTESGKAVPERPAEKQESDPTVPDDTEETKRSDAAEEREEGKETGKTKLLTAAVIALAAIVVVLLLLLLLKRRR